jgi:hypothetical protein
LQTLHTSNKTIYLRNALTSKAFSTFAITAMNKNIFLYAARSYALAFLVLLIFTSATAPKPEAPRKLKWKERVLLNIVQKKIEKQQRKALSPKPKKAKTEKRPVHWANVVALICGVLIFFGGITAIAALVFGIIGINNSGEGTEYSGEGMGIAGVVLGGLVILLALAILITFLAIFL